VKSARKRTNLKAVVSLLRDGVTRRNRDSANLLESVYENFAWPWREMRGNFTNFAGITLQED
jgi:hypothetical protein